MQNEVLNLVVEAKTVIATGGNLMNVRCIHSSVEKLKYRLTVGRAYVVLGLSQAIKDHVYGYPKKLILLICLGIPMLLIIGLVVILVSPENGWKYPAFDAAIGIAFIAIYSFVCFYVRGYFIRIESTTLSFGSMFYRRIVEFQSIRRFVVLEGGRGGQILELYDEKKRLVFRLADTVQDFGDLMAEIRRRLPPQIVEIESRDKWGKWTRRKAP